jgi:CCR4-NOT transcriptional complex subunit CAF120
MSSSHLIPVRVVRDIKTTLIRGQMEGFVRVRVAGQTDWKRMYMVISGGLDSSAESISGADPQKKKRISSLFGRDQGPAASGPVQPRISMFASPKPKDRKKAVLTLTKVTQAFAVYPDRPELIARSTLMKIEGLMGDEQAAGGMRCREGWWMVLPDIEPGSNQAAEMLRWVVGP